MSKQFSDRPSICRKRTPVALVVDTSHYPYRSSNSGLVHPATRVGRSSQRLTWPSVSIRPEVKLVIVVRDSQHAIAIHPPEGAVQAPTCSQGSLSAASTVARAIQGLPHPSTTREPRFRFDAILGARDHRVRRVARQLVTSQSNWEWWRCRKMWHRSHLLQCPQVPRTTIPIPYRKSVARWTFSLGSRDG